MDCTLWNLAVLLVVGEHELQSFLLDVQAGKQAVCLV